MSVDTRRRLLLTGSFACAAAAGALFWHYAANGPALAFEPPAEDICIVPPTRTIAAIPYDPDSGLTMLAPRAVPAGARCPVCGMYPSRFARWAAQVIFADGAAHFFDSPVDVFLFLAEPARYDEDYKAGDVRAIHVADFGGKGWSEARDAHYVIGSAARGPMRSPDLPAFADAADAAAHVAEHGGRVLRFAEIDSALLDGLRQSTHAGHGH
ncbi:nitrous oxide reductase accessory protein NosL [Thauera phenolivorans]|nr:nitrous oxide reductase accessory protein NosL [Thauera phenolivorans]